MPWKTQLTFLDDAVASVLWSMAETAMTIVATSIPVLRVFFKRAVNTARDYYSTSDRTKKTNQGNAASMLAHGSGMRTIRKTTHVDQSFSSNNSMADVLRRGSKTYVELDDLAVGEKTSRVTASIPESVPESTDQKYW